MKSENEINDNESPQICKGFDIIHPLSYNLQNTKSKEGIEAIKYIFSVLIYFLWSHISNKNKPKHSIIPRNDTILKNTKAKNEILKRGYDLEDKIDSSLKPLTTE